MMPGMQCVLETLRGQAGRRSINPSEWEDAIALAERQHVLPLLAHKLRQAKVSLPSTLQARLAEAERETLLYSFLQSSELKELLRSFAASKIAVIPLKGPSLAERVYGRASLRISRDLDLLVRKADFAVATSLLERLAFAPEERPDDYHQKWQRGSTIVELHFDIENPLAIDFNVESAWRAAHLAEFGGQPAWRFAAKDEFLFLCLHGVRHRFERLSLIVDISLALKRLALKRNPELHLRREVSDASRFVTLGCAMASRLYPDDSAPLESRSEPSKLAMERLANLLWNDLLTRPASQQDWNSMHQFYLETELTTFRRLYRRLLHLRILASRLIEPDFLFAQRFGLQRRWQVWLLRPARLASRHRSQ